MRAADNWTLVSLERWRSGVVMFDPAVMTTIHASHRSGGSRGRRGGKNSDDRYFKCSESLFVLQSFPPAYPLTSLLPPR